MLLVKLTLVIYKISSLFSALLPAAACMSLASADEYRFLAHTTHCSQLPDTQLLKSGRKGSLSQGKRC